MFAKLVVLVGLIAVCSATTRPCANNAPMPSRISIEGCEVNASTRCKLRRGTEVTGFMDFEATMDTPSLRPQIIATAFGVRAEFELPEDRQVGCNWLQGSQCPISQGEDVVWKLNMPVLAEYPLVQLLIEVSVYSATGVPQFSRMFVKLLVLLGLIAVSSAGLLRCANNAPMPNRVVIPGCDGITRCKLRRGTDIIVDFDFEAISATPTIRPQVIATAFGVRAEFELPDDRQIGCNWLEGSQCPISQGEDVTWILNMPILAEYPLVQLLIEVSVIGADGRPHFLLFVLAVLPAIFAIDFKTCPEGPPPIEGLTDYCTTLPCKLVRGETIKADIRFKMPSAVTKLTPQISGKLFGLTQYIDLPEDRREACVPQWLGGRTCPIEAGEEVIWTLDMPIENNQPLVNIDLKIQLLDQNKKIVMCLLFPVNVVRA
ncbi:unnamed protein product [Diamesa serratosioi]